MGNSTSHVRIMNWERESDWCSHKCIGQKLLLRLFAQMCLKWFSKVISWMLWLCWMFSMNVIHHICLSLHLIPHYYPERLLLFWTWMNTSQVCSKIFSFVKINSLSAKFTNFIYLLLMMISDDFSLIDPLIKLLFENISDTIKYII